EVGGGIAAAGLGGAERDRAQGPAAGDQWDYHRRLKAGPAEDPEVLGAASDDSERLGREIRVDLRAAGADDLRDARRGFRIGGIAAVHLPRQLHLRRVLVRRGDAADRAVFLDDI